MGCSVPGKRNWPGSDPVQSGIPVLYDIRIQEIICILIIDHIQNNLPAYVLFILCMTSGGFTDQFINILLGYILIFKNSSKYTILLIY